jgi:hypothetical protein
LKLSRKDRTSGLSAGSTSGRQLAEEGLGDQGRGTVRADTVGRAGLQDGSQARVKVWASTHLSAGSALRSVLERESDEIPVGDLVGKIGVWLQLLEIEEDRR